MVKEEITFELTNFCEGNFECKGNCKYCSSNAIYNIDDKNIVFLSINKIKKELKGNFYERINISGGEPLAHPNFYRIYKLCKKHAKDVPVYSNLITHRLYNANVIDGVYLEANLTLLPEVDKIHILRRVKQGKEKNRPEVHLSRNYRMNCLCDHRVITPTGEKTLTQCNKSTIQFKKDIYHNKIYISGAHGVGKSTLILDSNKKLNIEIYENTSKNPYKEDIFKRQLWRLLKYITDDEIIRTNEKLLITNRCYIDWLVYTKTFKDLGWITIEQYNILLEKYNNYFKNKIPINIVYINPDINWSKERILERWSLQPIKFREENFEYYDILRKNYNNIINGLNRIENITEITDTDKLNRINCIDNIVKQVS